MALERRLRVEATIDVRLSARARARARFWPQFRTLEFRRCGRLNQIDSIALIQLPTKRPDRDSRTKVSRCGRGGAGSGGVIAAKLRALLASPG